MKKIKKFEKLGSKIRDLNRSITKNSYEYDEKHMNVEFNSDELPLNKAIAIPSMIIVIRAVFFMKIAYIIHKFSQINVCINYRRVRVSRTTNLNRRTKKQKLLQKIQTAKKKFIYFTCTFINYNCINDGCQYLLLSGNI